MRFRYYPETHDSEALLGKKGEIFRLGNWEAGGWGPHSWHKEYQGAGKADAAGKEVEVGPAGWDETGPGLGLETESESHSHPAPAWRESASGNRCPLHVY